MTLARPAIIPPSLHRDAAAPRRYPARWLLALALGKVVLVVLLAEALGRVSQGGGSLMMGLLAVGGLAAMASAGLLLLGWTAQDLAEGAGHDHGSPGETRP